MDLELWGGHECTVNRVGDQYRDQTLLTGHHDRPDDLARFADLGITRLRYPVLWKRVAPARPDDCDWRWSDDRLREISRLGMQPIVGLLHHGSGPHYTSLIADDFATYAAAVAQRYPAVTDWTPINEPLTTTRFSALYGVWYPHARDERLFWIALLNQIDGIRGAMRAIRRVNPAARLIPTEDLGRYYSTPQLAAKAEHMNDRCWMTGDLLTGKVTAAFFSADDPHNFAMAVEDALRNDRPFLASPEHVVSPTFVPDLVRACLDLVIEGETGIWHLANDGAVNWHAFAHMLADALGLDPAPLEAADANRLNWVAPRPVYAALGSRRGRMMPGLKDAVARYAAARRPLQR